MQQKNILSILGLAILLTATSTPAVFADRFDDRMGKQEGQAGRKHSKKHMSAAAEAAADNATYRMAGQDFKMRTHDHGKLTRRDKRKLNRELNRNENRIKSH